MNFKLYRFIIIILNNFQIYIESINWSATSEHEACPGEVDRPSVSALEKTDFPSPGTVISDRNDRTHKASTAA